MTDEQRAELKRLAEAAPKGPWRPRLVAVIDLGGTITHEVKSEHDGCVVAEVRFRPMHNDTIPEDNTYFIAAANPAAVLDLLSDLREATDEAERLRRMFEAGEVPLGLVEQVVESVGSTSGNEAHAAVWRLLATIEARAKAEAAGKCWDGEAIDAKGAAILRMESERDAILTENERLKAEVRRLQFELNGEEP